MDLIGHLNTLETAGLVSLVKITPDLEYLFRHTLVQDAAYSSLLASDQKRLHREVGEALEILYPEQREELAPTLARHFELAAQPERAFNYFRLAAAKALETYANQEAENHLCSALDLARNPSETAEVLAQLGEALFRQSRNQEAIQVWREGIALYHDQGNSDATARLYARSARAAWFFNEYPLSLNLCLEGMRALAGAPESIGIASLAHETARAYYFNNQSEKGMPLCRQALEMAERLGAVDVQAEALTTLGIFPGLPQEEDMQVLTRAVELVESANLLHIAFRAHINLGSAIQSFSGDTQRARQQYQRAADVARRRGALQEELFALTAVGGMLLEEGELNELSRLIEELEARKQQLPNPEFNEIEIMSLKTGWLGMQGRWQEALPLIRNCRELLVQKGNTLGAAKVSVNIAEAVFEKKYLGMGDDLGEVEIQLHEARGYIDKLPGMRAWLETQLGSLYAYQGRFPEAHRMLDEARQSASQEVQNTVYTDIVIMQGEIEIAALEKRLIEHIDLFDELEKYRRRLNPLARGRVLLRQAEAYLARGEADDLEHSQRVVLEAQGLFQKLGATPYLAVVQKLWEEANQKTLLQAAAQRKVAQELAMAGKMQETFLPAESPHLSGWQIAATFMPARETSGDYYDFIPLPNQLLGIVIADVTDKGMGAALYMASSRSLLRAYAAEFPNEPARVLVAANQRITSDTRGGLFVTLFYGVLQPATGRLVYVNAGHNPPMLRQGGAISRLSATGIPLGVYENVSWQQASVQLEPGAALALYTDGITEAEDVEEHLFGEERLESALLAVETTNLQTNNAGIIQQSILSHIQRFRGAAPQSDDITLVVITREG